MSEVIWVDADNMHFDNAVSHKLQKLLDAAEADRALENGMRVALKINTAEAGYDYGLRPGFFRPVAEQALRATGTRPVLCDGIKLADAWRQVRGTNYLKIAAAQGYTNETLGGHFVINGGFSGDEGDIFDCRRINSEIGGVEVGTAVCRSDSLWVVSHVTLHPLFGLGGALLNGGFECLVSRARTRLLKSINPYIFDGQGPSRVDLQAFQRRALESFLGVRHAVANKMLFFNFLWDVTPQPEFYPYSDKPVVANLGFLASRDAVALDQATLDLLSRQNTAERTTVGGIGFNDLLDNAQHLGIGQREYTLRHLS